MQPVLMRLALTLAMAVQFAVADRMAGADWVTAWRDRLLVWAGRQPAPVQDPVAWLAKARPAVWAAVALTVMLIGDAAVFGAPFEMAWLSLPWLLWRLPGWGVVPGASIDPGQPLQVLATFARHLFGLAAVPVLMALHADFSVAVTLRLTFALLATVLAWVEYEVAATLRTDCNAGVEKARGAIDGLTLALAFV